MKFIVSPAENVTLSILALDPSQSKESKIIELFSTITPFVSFHTVLETILS